MTTSTGLMDSSTAGELVMTCGSLACRTVCSCEEVVSSVG